MIIDTTEEVGGEAAAVTVDTAVCGECLAEMGAAGDRRFGMR